MTTDQAVDIVRETLYFMLLLSTPILGAGLAIALLTTLYGVIFARLVFQPAADKTLQRAKIARFRNQLMAEGFVMLSEERGPSFVEARINSFLDPELVAKLPKRKRAGAQ